MGHEVYYEVYPDVIFGLHFGLNLFVLTLVNGSLHRAAGGGRICLGSLAGALCTLGALYLPGLLRSISSGQPRLSKALALLPAGLPGMLGPALALPVMAGVTFGTFWGRGFWQVAERLTLYSFGLGGGLLLLLRLFPRPQWKPGIQWEPGIRWESGIRGIPGILGAGAVCFLVMQRRARRRDRAGNICRVTLAGSRGKLTVNALLDSGNSLREPISQRPVSILDRRIFESVWGEEDRLPGPRVIPYHSIGRRRGILEGYRIPEMWVELQGVKKRCRDIYVGLAEDGFSQEGPYEMILSPWILEEGSGASPGGQTV